MIVNDFNVSPSIDRTGLYYSYEKMSQPRNIRVAIIGGGIGGVVLAIALSRFPHITFTIYESRGAYGEIGAGVGFSNNAHQAMNLIDPRIWEVYHTNASFNGWDEKQNVWFDFTVGERGENEGKRIIEVKLDEHGDCPQILTTCHRAHFLDALVGLLPEGVSRFNKKLASVWQDEEKVICKFADGTEVEADVVVGCDGIRSVTRRFVVGDPELATPKFTGKLAFRGLVPMKAAEEALGKEHANNRHVYIGHGGHMLTFPVAHGTLMNVVAMHSSPQDTWTGEWVQPFQEENARTAFDGSRWGSSVQKIMQVCRSSYHHFDRRSEILKAHKLLKAPDVWAIFHHPQTPSFHKGQICLLGDAAHATSPHYGQGACMAIEDAYILSNLLSKCCSRTDILKALDAYDAVRVPRTSKIVSGSFEHGRRLDLQDADTGDDLEKLAQELNTGSRWIWNTDLKAELAKAISRFQDT